MKLRKACLLLSGLAVALCIMQLFTTSFRSLQAPTQIDRLRVSNSAASPDAESSSGHSGQAHKGETLKAAAESRRRLGKNSAASASSAFLLNFLVGGIAGAFAKTCTAPIERVKLLIQTQDANPEIVAGKVARYTGIANCFTRVAAEQGMAAFWRGNLANVLRYFPTQAFNFAFKDSIKAMFPHYSARASFALFLLVNMASGGLAGAGSLCLVYPLDFARTRLASDVGKTKEFSGLGDCLRKTVARGGTAALYSGFVVSVCGIIPYRGVYFGLYDTAKEMNPYKDSIAVTFAIAQAVAIVAAYVAYPFDTVRRRLQMQSGAPREQWLYSGSWDCVGRMRREEGFAAFFKGAGANALRTMGSALVLVLYDVLKKALQAQEQAGALA
jgi:solute carrier family 25 (adenine nucleotide translocator) protein 4/5/6/31